MFCRCLVTACFVADLLWRVVVLLTISFFVCVSSSNGKVQSDKVIQSNLVRQYAVDWNLRYFRHCWIIKCVGLEPILFAINKDAASSSKAFSTLDFVFSIDCIANLVI